MTQRLTISLPDDQAQHLQERLQRGDFESADAYIRALIAQDQGETIGAELEALLLQGLHSGEAIHVADVDAWLDGLRRRVLPESPAA